MKHLTYDGFHGFRSRLDDILLVNECLAKMPHILGLEPIMPPFLLPYYDGVHPEDCGISSFLFLLGGHITIHTFSYREAVFADVLAPSFFSETKFSSLMERLFPCKTQRVSHIKRNPAIDKRKHANSRSDFGPHLFVEYVSTNRMTDLGKLFNIFDRLPEAINMTPIMRPYVVNTKTKDGNLVLSAITMIAESHISCHVFTKSNRAFFDIFSCRFFNIDRVLSKLSRVLGTDPLSTFFCPRGIGFKREAMSRVKRYKTHNLWTEYAASDVSK